MISFEIKGFDRMVEGSNPKIINKAMNTALHRTSLKLRTKLIKEVRKVYAVTAGDVRLTASNPLVLSRDPARRALVFTSGRTPIDKFKPKARLVKTGRGDRIGVTVRVRKDRGRRLIKKHGARSGAFFAKGMVMARKGKSQYPIMRLSSLAIAQMAGTRYISAKGLKLLEKETPVQFESALKFYLSKVK